MSESRFSSNFIGYATAIIQAIFYSTMGIFGKLLYATGLDAQQVMILRFLCTVAFLGALLLVWRKYPLFSKQAALYLQSAFFFVSAWTYLLAVEHMNAGLVTVVFYTFPAVVAVLDVIFFHARLTWRILLALALSAVGIVFISGLLEPGIIYIEPMGMAFAVISCLGFAVYSILIQRTARVDSSFTSTFSLGAVGLAASLVFFAPEVPATFEGIDLYQIGLASGLAIIATILPIVLYIVSIRYIGATKASILSLIETPASLFLCWLILGETLSAWQFVGVICIVVALLVITVKTADAKSSGARFE